MAVEISRSATSPVTASGASAAITWIGPPRHEGRRCCPPFHQQPVHVRAGAFGHGLPARDLFLSPGHPVLGRPPMPTTRAACSCR